MKADELRATLHALLEEWGKGEAIRTLLVLATVAARHQMTQTALMESLGVDYTTATIVVRRLVVAGLIESTIDPAHRSRRLLALTAQGRALLGRAGVTI